MKNEQLEQLARTVIGDRRAPQLFFVSLRRLGVVTVSRSFDVAYAQWQDFARTNRSEQPMLEDRLFGTIASVEIEEDGGTRGPYIVTDDSRQYLKNHTIGV